MKRLLRQTLVRVVAILLRPQSRPYPFPAVRALVVAPHADDEVLGCGGLIAAKRQRGHEVDVVFVSDSAASPDGREARPARAAQRRSEALRALELLGVAAARVEFIDAPDGSLDRLGPDAYGRVQQRLVAILGRARPDEIFVPFLGEGSTEHDAAHWLVRAALGTAGCSAVVWEYAVWAWWNPLRLAGQILRPRENFRVELGELRARKLAALACHESQLNPAGSPALPPEIAAAGTQPVEYLFRRR